MIKIESHKRINHTLVAGQEKKLLFFLAKSNKKTIINFKLNELSQVQIFLVAAGSAAVNVELNIHLIGKRSQAIVSLVGLSIKEARHNFLINLRHIGRKTYSRVNCRRISFDASESSCYSKIIVEPTADGADTHLSDKSIFIGINSKIKSSPVLEIKNSNVKASHGAATGKISPLELFYLQTRGLTEVESQSIILKSFINEILPDEIYTRYDLIRKLKLYVSRNRN